MLADQLVSGRVLDEPALQELTFLLISLASLFSFLASCLFLCFRFSSFLFSCLLEHFIIISVCILSLLDESALQKIGIPSHLTRLSLSVCLSVSLSLCLSVLLACLLACLFVCFLSEFLVGLLVYSMSSLCGKLAFLLISLASLSALCVLHVCVFLLVFLSFSFHFVFFIISACIRSSIG